MKNLISILMILSFGLCSQAFGYEQSDASKKYDSQNGGRSYNRDSSYDRGSRSYKDSSRERKYDSNFRSNYSKYKKYSPERKERYQKKWSSFKKRSDWNNMSPDQKSKLKKRVLERKRNKRKSYR